MILKTLETMGPQHGYGIARRIEQTSGHMLLVNYGTLYPALLKLEQEGYIKSAWGVSDNNRTRQVLPAHARRPRSRSSAKRASGTRPRRSWRGSSRPTRHSVVRPLRAWLVRLRHLFGRARTRPRVFRRTERASSVHIDDNIRAGMTLDEARRTALLTLGGVDMTKEQYRDHRSLPMLESMRA